MAHPRGESGSDAVRLDFYRRLMLQFRGFLVASRPHTRFDRDGRRRSGRRTQWQEWSARIGRVVPAVAIWSPCRIRGCERRRALRHDPAMRWIVGGKAAQRSAASPNQMGRFETQWLAAPENLSALADLSGQRFDLVHGRRPRRGTVLDMDLSVSPTHGERVEVLLQLLCVGSMSSWRVKPA